jgi:DNA-binding response OmpR family regulator
MKNNQKTVLVVDDNPANLAVLFDALEEAGYRVLISGDGQTALKVAPEAQPDLILLDIMMPELDGLETCRSLKKTPQTAEIPVIFLTALVDPLDKVNGFNVGGVDYLTKPLEISEVLVRVRTHLALRQLQQELQAVNATLAQRNADLEMRNHELQQALQTIKTISGIVPLCAWCHNKIRDGAQWVELTTYLHTHTDAEITHGVCPDCMKNLRAENRGNVS